MRKVLIIQRILSHYNVPLYLELSKKFEITLAYSEKDEDKANCVNSEKINYPSGKEWKYMSKEEYEKNIEDLVRKCREYDAIILPMEPHKKILCVIEELRKYTKVLLWGIGVTASYNTRYDSEEYKAPSFESMIAMADASVFYMNYPKEKYLQRGIPEQKMFVAPNTVEVLNIELEMQKKEFLLFVGTLLKQKRVDLLLNVYRQAYEENNEIPVLKIIGEGEEFESLSLWIKKNNLSHKIEMIGSIYNEEELRNYFAGALATISADQAGLSVLKSMGYGVPFITYANAITGGELLNIQNGINGVLFERIDDLKAIILDITEKPEKYKQMGKNAYQYYYSCRTIKDCAQGFEDALQYVFMEV